MVLFSWLATSCADGSLVDDMTVIRSSILRHSMASPRSRSRSEGSASDRARYSPSPGGRSTYSEASSSDSGSESDTASWTMSWTDLRIDTRTSRSDSSSNDRELSPYRVDGGRGDDEEFFNDILLGSERVVEGCTQRTITAVLESAESALEMRNYHGAIALCTRALKLNRCLYRAFEIRASAYVKLDKCDVAHEDLTSALGSPDAIEPSIRARLLRSRAVTCQALDFTEMALDDFEASILLDSSSADAHTGAGCMLWKLGRLDHAIHRLHDAIALCPTDEVAVLVRAMILEKRGNLNAAFKDWDTAVRLKPLDANAVFHRASLHSRLGRLGGAMDDYDRAILLDPTFYAAYIGRGDIFFRMKDRDRALIDYSAALALRETSSAYIKRGIVFLRFEQSPGLCISRQTNRELRRVAITGEGLQERENRFHRAIADFDRAILLGHGSLSKLYFYRSIAFRKLNLLESALLDSESALLLEPSNVRYLLNRGRINTALGDLESALEDTRNALAQDPANEIATAREMNLIKCIRISKIRTIEGLLDALSLQAFASRFQRQNVTLEDVQRMTDERELRSLIPSFSSRRSLLSWAAKLPSASITVPSGPESENECENLGEVCPQVPLEFLCPITRVPMRDPVVAVDGHTCK